MRPLTFCTALATLFAGTLHADILVTFRDGAPKDRFTVVNTGSCATGPMTITIDLASAPAGLIFDVTGQGAGVEVFQPLELVSGAESVTSVSELADGDQRVSMTVSDLAAETRIAFTADLDDTGGGREITVSGSEMTGAMVRVSTDEALAEGVFDETGQARVVVAACAA